VACLGEQAGFLGELATGGVVAGSDKLANYSHYS
jgi:hypothetical protein